MRRRKIMKVYEMYSTYAPLTRAYRIVCLRCLRTGRSVMSCQMFHVKRFNSLSNSGTVVRHTVVIWLSIRNLMMLIIYLIVWFNLKIYSVIWTCNPRTRTLFTIYSHFSVKGKKWIALPTLVRRTEIFSINSDFEARHSVVIWLNIRNWMMQMIYLTVWSN